MDVQRADAPTDQQLREIRALRTRDGIPLTNLPSTQEAANAEISKFRTGDGKSEYVIRGRIKQRQAVKKRGSEKAYAEQLQRQIEEAHAQLKADFLEREARRRAAM